MLCRERHGRGIRITREFYVNHVLGQNDKVVCSGHDARGEGSEKRGNVRPRGNFLFFGRDPPARVKREGLFIKISSHPDNADRNRFSPCPGYVRSIFPAKKPMATRKTAVPKDTKETKILGVNGNDRGREKNGIFLLKKERRENASRTLTNITKALSPTTPPQKARPANDVVPRGMPKRDMYDGRGEKRARSQAKKRTRPPAARKK